MAILKGIEVVLVDKKKQGEDAFGHPLFVDLKRVVDNVLIAPVSTEDVISTVNLTGKKAEYVLAIPKDDTNDWSNKEVIFYGKRWRTIGHAQEGLAHHMPLPWNKKIQVERYE